MKSSPSVNFSIDRGNKKIMVKKEFTATIPEVWAAWTESQLLEQWWAPKPWQAKTKTMDFKEGGYWLYAMVGPDGTEHWGRADFKSITPLKSYSAQDVFCDENGNINDALPKSFWIVEFNEVLNSTMVSIEIAYDNLSDLETVLEMGIQEGFTAALENLDALINSW